MGPGFFLLGCGGGDFLVFFPCSHQVPFKFPKFFLRRSQYHLNFIPYGLPQNSTLMYINWKGRLLGSTFVFILQPGGQRGAFMRECSIFQKNCSGANEDGSFKKTRKSYEDLVFFSQVHGRGGSFVFCLLPTCSQCGPIGFPKRSPSSQCVP